MQVTSIRSLIILQTGNILNTILNQTMIVSGERYIKYEETSFHQLTIIAQWMIF